MYRILETDVFRQVSRHVSDSVYNRMGSFTFEDRIANDIKSPIFEEITRNVQ